MPSTPQSDIIILVLINGNYVRTIPYQIPLNLVCQRSSRNGGEIAVLNLKSLQLPEHYSICIRVSRDTITVYSSLFGAAGFYRREWWKNSTSTDCTDAQVEAAIQGYFTSDANPQSLSALPGISGKVQHGRDRESQNENQAISQSIDQ